MWILLLVQGVRLGDNSFLTTSLSCCLKGGRSHQLAILRDSFFISMTVYFIHSPQHNPYLSPCKLAQTIRICCWVQHCQRCRSSPPGESCPPEGAALTLGFWNSRWPSPTHSSLLIALPTSVCPKSWSNKLVILETPWNHRMSTRILSHLHSRLYILVLCGPEEFHR